MKLAMWHPADVSFMKSLNIIFLALSLYFHNIFIYFFKEKSLIFLSNTDKYFVHMPIKLLLFSVRQNDKKTLSK